MMRIEHSETPTNWLGHRQLGECQHDWTLPEVEEIMNLPFNDLLFSAQIVHRQHHDANKVQVSTLCSIKTGGCAEDCSYCSQSARYKSSLKRQPLLPTTQVVHEAKKAQESGATRFCMGAAWRDAPSAGKQFDRVLEMVREVKSLGLETCATLGMLSSDQAKQLAESGLDYYNHNLDTSREYYPEVITTRKFEDRLETLDFVRQAGMKVCSGGIIGLGESTLDRAKLLHTFATMKQHPESLPVNLLVPIEGTPLYKMRGKTCTIEFVRVIATARILMPKTIVRLSAGRNEMNDETQALCFACGANSIFYGEKLLTADNCEIDRDKDLMEKLGIHFSKPNESTLKKQSESISTDLAHQ